MKATYIGNLALPENERDVPKTFEMFGITFERGKAADIPTDLQAKFAGNSHFDTTGKVDAKAETETVATMAERIATVDDVDALKAELANETRATGKAALEARIAILEAPAS